MLYVILLYCYIIKNCPRYPAQAALMSNLVFRERTQFRFNHDIKAEGSACINQTLGEEPQHRVADFTKRWGYEACYAQSHTGGQHRHSRPCTYIRFHTTNFLTTDSTNFTDFFNTDCMYFQNNLRVALKYIRVIRVIRC